MNVRSRNRSVVATHSLSLDMRLRLDLWPRPQFWRCHRQKPRPPLRPPRPRRRPQTRRSLGQSGVRSGVAGELNGDRNAARDAQSGGKSGAQDATSDGTRATAPQPPPPSKKSSRSFVQLRQPGRLSAGPGRPHNGPPAPGYRTTGKPRQRAIGLDATLAGALSLALGHQQRRALHRNLLLQRIATQMWTHPPRGFDFTSGFSLTHSLRSGFKRNRHSLAGAICCELF